MSQIPDWIRHVDVRLQELIEEVKGVLTRGETGHHEGWAVIEALRQAADRIYGRTHEFGLVHEAGLALLREYSVRCHHEANQTDDPVVRYGLRHEALAAIRCVAILEGRCPPEPVVLGDPA